MKPEDQKIVHETLVVFQQVLNWCDQIEDEDSRLPLDLLEEANKRINAATIKFQPEMIPATIQGLKAIAPIAIELLQPEKFKNWLQVKKDSVGTSTNSGDCPISTYLKECLAVPMLHIETGVYHLHPSRNLVGLYGLYGNRHILENTPGWVSQFADLVDSNDELTPITPQMALDYLEACNE